MKKLTAKQHHIISTFLMAAGVIINLIDMLQDTVFDSVVPLIISIVLVAAGVVYSLIFVRCPHCGDKLKNCKNHFPDNCPSCGKSLNKLPEEV